jgi:hypothetical protein
MNLVVSPGHMSSFFHEIDITHQLELYEIFRRAKTVKPVLILSVNKFGPSGQLLI